MTAPRPVRVSPVERFLGPAEAAGGPFALLGMSPSAVSDEIVLAALDRQIERIAAHTERDTPEADEVRLALHAVAAQLLDPVVRRHLIARWGGTVSDPIERSGHTAPTRQATVSNRGPDRILEQDAILALALFGGWNHRSMRRLVSVAHHRGLSTAEVAQTLRGMATRRRAPASQAPRLGPLGFRRAADIAGAESAAPAARPMPRSSLPSRIEDPGQRLLRRAILLGFAAVTGLAVVITAIIVATRPARPTPTLPPTPPSQTTPIQNPTPRATTPQPATVAPTAKPAAERAEATVLADLPRSIGRAAEGLATDPAHAAREFERLARILADSWPDLPRDRLAAANDAVIDFLYHAGASPAGAQGTVGLFAAWAAPLSSDAPLRESDLAPSIWSAATLHRVLRERDLPAQARTVAEYALRDLDDHGRTPADAGFEAAALALVSGLPSRLARTSVEIDPAAWSRWALIVEAMGLDTPALRAPLLLGGLETLLVEGPESNASKPAADAIASLVASLTWRAGDDSRRWALRWFGDRRISPADLNALTTALATRSSAEGVDVTMVLSTSASDSARAALRDRYAKAWSLDDSVKRDEVAAALLTRARELIDASRVASGDVQELAASARLARLHDAASWLWRGDGQEAAAILGQLAAPIDRALAPTRIEGAATRLALTEGAWAEQFLGARQNAKLRREKLESANFGPGDVGATDAEVLVGEAISGSPVEVRNKALDIVRQFRGSPAIINAVLERLPKIPPGSVGGRAVIEAIVQQQLPAAKDSSWGLVARRLLVEKLLEALAAESPRAAIDRLAIVLAQSYRSIAAPAPLPPDQRAASNQPPASVTAAAAWTRLRAGADLAAPSVSPLLSLRQIDQRRAGRLAQARGPVQRFGAEQVSVAELLGYLVAAERPVLAPRAAEIIQSLISDRRESATIFEQILATERAIVDLWVLRFSEDAS
ncbi:MAG: hypothetical protein ACKVW3_10515 [Phycisphaerales bacterium]